MAARRRQYLRKRGHKRFRSLFVLAVEGAKTEPEYFDILNKWASEVQIICLACNGKTTPRHIENLFVKFERGFRSTVPYDKWIVIDKDRNSNRELRALRSCLGSKFTDNVVVSNPKFEFWLLLHFEHGSGLRSPKDCDRRLRKYLSHYSKGVSASDISPECVAVAIERAATRDRLCLGEWPQLFGTTVYKLVSRIMNG